MKRPRPSSAAAGTELACVELPKKVDDFVKAEIARQLVPGAAVAVVADGRVVKAGAYGLANVELRVPVKHRTVFQIQSITKQFTATSVMMFVEEGKIGLDDMVSKYVAGTPDTWQDITVRQLLSHTSGIKDFINEPTTDLRLEMTDEDVLKATTPRPLNFKAGDQWQYSNTNYSILSLIIRSVTGKWYGDVLRERVFEPLRMKDTRIYSWSELIPNRASGYLAVDGKLINGRFISESVLGYPGGGMCSTILDLAKWDAALYTEKILKTASLRQMWTPATLKSGEKAGYGFGWAVGQVNGHTLISHGGAHITGFRSTIMRFVDDQLTVIVLVNSASCDPDCIAQGVAAFYVPALAKE